MEKYFVSNNKVLGTKVLTTIENELSKCTSFSISVAFITSGGIVTLLETLRELEQKKIPGRILTTDYLMFSDPKALNKLSQFSNIDLRMYNCQDKEGFHTKGYIFDTGSDFHILMGSSNLTQSALTKNIEWNTSLIVDQDDEYKNALFNEFTQLWNSKHTQPYSLIEPDYQERYEDSKSVKRILKTFSEKNKIESLKPNLMQEAVIKCLNDSYDRGDNKGLLISATGTGKTYASAFAIKSLKPKRVLFLVHREQIAKQALKSYKRIFQDDKSYGLLSGNSKEYDSEFLFSTMQMMAKDESLSHFRKDEFDIIVIDEVHRAGAVSYQKIMNYFKPKYWFGMSASPERTDGFDIYSLFDHNILYEIRLQQALEDNLLCPFHYFGIRDLEIDGEVLGGDSYVDIAVIRTKKTDGLIALQLGNSENAKLGDLVFTIGNPLGYEYRGSVATGHLAGKDRLVSVSTDNSTVGSDWVMKVLQTDAAINPGNSGGPLMNANGEVIGVISMKLVQTEVEGMGFAIPIEYINSKIETLEKGEKIEWPLLGVSMINVSDAKNSYRYNFDIPNDIDSGVVVAGIESGSGAASSDLKEGDIITKIDGVEVEDSAYLRYELYKQSVGDTIEITYIRDGKEHTTKVVLSKNNS